MITLLTRYTIRRFFNKIYWKINPASDAQKLEDLKRVFKTNKHASVKTIDETIEYLIQHQCSIARFGDGEYLLCWGRSIGFQHRSYSLHQRLMQILSNPQNPKCIIGIPPFRTHHLTPFWLQFWHENIHDVIAMLVPHGNYVHQGISREVNLQQIEKLAQIWAHRNVIFVCGEGGRFQVSHPLFQNIASHTTITGPSKNAWDQYDALLKKVKTTALSIQNPLVICSLGPTATVLAYDLAQSNIQSLDIGHVTNVYDQLKFNAPKPEELV